MASIYKCDQDGTNLVVSIIDFKNNQVYYFCSTCNRVFKIDRKKRGDSKEE